MEFKEYIAASSIGEAYELLQESRSNVILGGTTFLRSGKASYDKAIDLCNCDLDYIREEDDRVCIGAYTSFRELEMSDIILNNFGTAIASALEHLIGVQLRNHITVGGHVYSRFGFSDFIPVLLALHARVKLYKAGELDLGAFLEKGSPRDILIEVIIPKEGRSCVVHMMRNSYSDYSLICIAVSAIAGKDWRVVAGARPGRALLVEDIMEQLKDLDKNEIKEKAGELGKLASETISFGSNFRAGEEYRRHLCNVFIKRALEELADVD